MFNISTFDEAIEYLGEQIGSDFLKALELSHRITENTSEFTGPQARIAAIKLAGYRTEIGLAAQVWKKTSVDTKKPQDRLIKDALMVMYDALLELINTLKVQSRFEKDTLA